MRYRGIPYVFHPAVLDACLHGVIHPDMTTNVGLTSYFLPSHIEAVFLYTPLIEHEVYSHVVLRQWNPGSYLFV